MRRLFWAAAIAAAMTVGGVASGAQEIRVGIYVLNLGKLDISSGAFTADFYLSLKSDQTIPDNCFEFLNGRASSIEKLEDKGNEKFYRVMANLSTPIDLRRFPYDSQKMEIILEHKTDPLEKVRFVALKEESGLDSMVNFPGWLVKGWDISVSEHEYSVYGETYSQLMYDVIIERIPFNSFLKTFLPVLFLMLIVTSSFVLNPEQVTTRLAAISSALVTSAMFHISISNQIPPVAYLTFADKFMVMTYLILLLCFFLSLATFVLQGRGKPERAKRLNKASEYIVFIGMPALYIGLFLLVR